MNRETIARIKKTINSLAPELEVLRGEKGEKGDSFTWRGKHADGCKYARFDVVTKGRSAYLATERTSQQPPAAPWVCIAQAIDGEKGDRGEQGIQGMTGKQGAVGPEGPRGERGEAGLRWAGAYQAGRRYEVGDVVGADGGAYVAIASTEQTPLGGAGWNTLAKGGETGPRGMKGDVGFDAANILSITNSTESSSTTTGAVVVTGGVGIGGAIYAGGNVVMASGNGIDFSADASAAGATSELLDDYEEGTWTPKYAATTGAFGTNGEDVILAYYTKIGRLVTVSATYRIDSFSAGTGSGILRISGLPFTPISSGTTQLASGVVSQALLWAANRFPFAVQAATGQTFLNVMYRAASDGTVSFVDATDLTNQNNGNQITFSISYPAA